MLSSSLLLLLLAAFTNTTIIRRRGRYIWILLILFLSLSLFSLPISFLFCAFLCALYHYLRPQQRIKASLASHYTNGQIIVLSVPFPASTVSQHTHTLPAALGGTTHCTAFLFIGITFPIVIVSMCDLHVLFLLFLPALFYCHCHSTGICNHSFLFFMFFCIPFLSPRASASCCWPCCVSSTSTSSSLNQFCIRLWFAYNVFYRKQLNISVCVCVCVFLCFVLFCLL